MIFDHYDLTMWIFMIAMLLLILYSVNTAVLIFLLKKRREAPPKKPKKLKPTQPLRDDLVEVNVFGETLKISREEAKKLGLKPNEKKRR